MVEGFPDNLGGWSVVTIFKEGWRLLSSYFRLLHPFIMAFLLPVVLLELVQMLGFAWMISHGSHPHPHPHPHHHYHHNSLQPGHFLHHHFHPDQFYHHHFHHHYSGFQGFHSSSEGSVGSEVYAPTPAPTPCPHPHPPHPHPPVMMGLAVAIVMWLLISLAMAAISKIVEYIYANGEEDPSIIKSTFKSLPEALFRQFVTFLWLLLITAVTVFVISVPFHLILRFFKHSLNVHIVIILKKVLVGIVLLVLGIVFLFAQLIAVLEPANYGLAALKKSPNLFKTKLAPALIYVLADLVVAAAFSILVQFAVFFPATGKLPFWIVCILAILVALLYLAYKVYFLLVVIVLYFSSKLKYDAEEQYLPVHSEEDNPYTPLVVPSEN